MIVFIMEFVNLEFINRWEFDKRKKYNFKKFFIIFVS